MGNNTVMERMFRHEPAILLYAPLHTVIWGDPDGPAYLTSTGQATSSGASANAEITAVGVEVDRKLAALPEHLGVGVPDTLLTA